MLIYSAARRRPSGRCLSLFADGVLDRFASGLIAKDSLKIGVIIQRYMEGDISGVTFTADTKEMDSGKMSVSAALGPCSGVTDGIQLITSYFCDKRTGAVLGVSGDPKILNEDQLAFLIESGVRIEETIGYFQDIEWTMKDNELYILQARPITGFLEVTHLKAWEEDDGSDSVWVLDRDAFMPPLIGELVTKAVNQSGECAYQYGMQWDSAAFSARNGYIYRRAREIPGSKERIDSFLARINNQFDKGEDEFHKFIKPELSELIDAMHKDYIGKRLDGDALLSYLNDAEYFMERSSRVHWRATTSEWYMAHFFRKRVEHLFEEITLQDLVDMVYSKSLMTVEREKIYEMVSVVQSEADLHKLFTETSFDRILEARLDRMEGPAVRRLLNIMDSYCDKYGWMYTGEFEDAYLCRPGRISRGECVNRIRRYRNYSAVLGQSV